ncbi:hypothetical protein [Saccharopolyspora spinosa]|uniref:GNAT family N-acetyltransferase n=1 Tax=Saccharopolyspora spinosa TaxID=60894 RepID=A0A2N3XW84_SACSN|nr:hypothetical protein [Saccharopolyspora spinosa]PKW14861.1 hypothetical protein A8926_2514 [Saccharopolyspora spinosa]
METPHPDLVDALAGLWGRFTAAGGAAGFSPTDPVDQLRAAAAALVEDARNETAYLITIDQQSVPVGLAVLASGPQAHR